MLKKIHVNIQEGNQACELLVEEAYASKVVSLLNKAPGATAYPDPAPALDLKAWGQKAFSSSGGKTITPARIKANGEKSRAFWAEVKEGLRPAPKKRQKKTVEPT